MWEREFTNVLRTGCVRQRLDARRAQAVILQIGKLPIDVDREPVPRGELLAPALRFGLGTCEAAYLELAPRLQCPLATLHADLKTAALACGVGWLQP